MVIVYVDIFRQDSFINIELKMDELNYENVETNWLSLVTSYGKMLIISNNVAK